MALQRQLFREQALDFQKQQRRWGGVAELQPLSLKVAAWFLGLSVVAIGIFLFEAQYARKETVAGYLSPSSGTAKIFASTPGTIEEVHVRQGDLVQEGQPLLTVVANHIAANGTDLDANTLQMLHSQKAELQQNIAAEQKRAASERERLQAAEGGIQKQIQAIGTQIQIQSERLAIVQKDVNSAEQLRRQGIVSGVEYNRRQEQLLQQKQGLESLNQQIEGEQSKLKDTRFSLEQLPTMMAQKVQALRNELSNVEQRIAEVQARSAYVVRAPKSGKIATLQASVGETVDPHRLQLEIIPQGSPLQAELLVSPRAIGFIQPGQKVRLLYEAFPYQQFGTYSGHVVSVSQTLVTASDAAGPIRLKEPAYRVTATLDRSDIDAYGKRMPLQADMLLRADVILENRSLASWLLSPLHIRM